MSAGIGVSRAAGLALQTVFRGLKALRPDRPIHPAGVSLTGNLERYGRSSGSGIPWLDAPGTDDVQARLSRSIGVPAGWPDILGLALRISTAGKPSDILLASTGLSAGGRFLLRPARRADVTPFSSLMPYRGTHGPLLLAARTQVTASGPLPAAPQRFRRHLNGNRWVLGLAWARPRGPWTWFGELSLSLDDTADTPLRFDPVLNPLPDAGTYGWAKALRVPSYALARTAPGSRGRR